ncbi:MAG: glycosyltransferase, partial [Fibrobacteria bacterium]
MSSATNSRYPRYSVIIVTYNSRENIRVCLDSLRGCGSGYEIIVVDNNSKDGTGGFLAAQGDIRAILNTENHGFSKGCNQGAAIATGDYLIFLNPDTLVTAGWAEAMSRYFKDPSVGAVGPVSNYVAGLQRLDLNLPAAWRDRKIPGEGAIAVAANVARILAEANAGKGVTTRLLIGFCLMMPRPLFESLDGMDENLFLGNDDLDLSWRLRNLGRKLVVATDAFVFHEGQKSFRTEAKATVDRLTQESTDAMYVKLVHHYGGRERVPAPLELWGIGWFNPSPHLLAGTIPPLPAQAGLSKHTRDRKHEPEANVNNESRDLNAWKDLTVVIHVEGRESDEAATGWESASARVERTLSALPARSGAGILILNRAGRIAEPQAPDGSNLRKLDLGADFPIRQALELALALMAGSRGLFCLAGAETSSLFNHWLEKRGSDRSAAVLPLPLRIGDGHAAAAAGADCADCAGYAFLFRKEWLRDKLPTLPLGVSTRAFFAALGDSLKREAASQASGTPAGNTVSPPWLLARASDLPADAIAAAAAALPATAATSPNSYAPPRSSDPNWSAVAAEPPHRRAPEADTARFEAAPSLDGFGLYPESLQAAMRAAKDIAFAGATAELPPRSGAFRAFDPKGGLVPVSGQDLIILRVTPDMIDGLPDRMANIRRAAPGLKRMIAVFNGAQARHSEPASPLAPIDLTPEGIRAALWRSGFAVTGERPYRGFPNGTKEGEILQGWMQVEAVPRVMDKPTEKLVSIIILGFNQVEYTRKCLESIRMHTRQRYELILIDNGSKDGTEAYFRSIPGAKVVRNAENLGVSKGWNQGLRLAQGEYLLILNNDIIVGPDWLENMVRLAECDPSIGLVGPRSNYIAGPQVVPNVPYRAESEIQGFIRTWQAGHDLSAAEFQFIKGFCHLIPRRVFEKVGFYDERFGKGNFEDDDYCMRVRLHGFRALFADDSFIHHYGSVSFNQDSVDWRALMIENQGKYERKWAKGAEALNDTQVSDPQALQAPQPSLPHNAAPSKLEQGRLAYESGDLERARSLFLQAQAESPSDPEAYCSLGALMYSSGSVQEATSFFMRCLNLRPDHIDAAENLLECLAQRSGKASEGELAALASRYPSNPVFRPTVPSAVNAVEVKALPAWRQEAKALIEARKYVPAVDLLETRLRANADAGICHNYLGIIAHSCGDVEMALRNFAAALRHSPGDTDILFNYSDTLIAVGRCAEAATLLEDAARAALAAGQADPEAPDLAATAEQIRHAVSK